MCMVYFRKSPLWVDAVFAFASKTCRGFFFLTYLFLSMWITNPKWSSFGSCHVQLLVGVVGVTEGEAVVIWASQECWKPSIEGHTERLLCIVPWVIQGWDFFPAFKSLNPNGLTSSTDASGLGCEIPSSWGDLQCCHAGVVMTLALNAEGLSSLRPGVLQSCYSLPHRWIQLCKCLFWWLSKLQSECLGVLSLWCPDLPALYHLHACHWCQKLGLVLIQKSNCWISVGFVWCVSGLILWVTDVKIPHYLAIIIRQQWLTSSCLLLWQHPGTVCGWERLGAVLWWQQVPCLAGTAGNSPGVMKKQGSSWMT